MRQAFKNVIKSKDVSADAKENVRRAFAAAEAQFKQVWESLEQAYNSILEVGSRLHSERAELGHQIQLHNDQFPHLTGDEAEAYNAQAADLDRLAQEFVASGKRELASAMQQIDQAARNVDAWIGGPAQQLFFATCRGALNLTDDGPAMRQLREAERRNRAAHSVPPGSDSGLPRIPFDSVAFPP